MTWDVVLRLVNILGCLVSLLLLARAYYYNWKKWNAKTRFYWWALVGWTFLGLEGTIEVLLQGVDPGPRTIIQTLVVAWTLRALTIEQKVESDPVGLRIKRKEEPKDE